MKQKNLGRFALSDSTRSFYCIKDHDNEVGCSGLLFYSASEPPLISIPPAEKEKFELLWKMFSLEMNAADSLQFEMLQMMLKRFIILFTRLYKGQREWVETKVDALLVCRADLDEGLHLM